MALRLYFDHNVRRPVVEGLRLRGVDVLMAPEDDAHRLQDPELLDRATSLDRVLAGLVYAHQTSLSVGECIAELELVAKVCSPEELRGRVLFLPLR